MGELADRVEALEWERLGAELDERGFSMTAGFAA
jgi:hypothetical protein